MSGHSKWSKIKRKKGAEDTKRSKIFSRILKEIAVAVREGGSPEPEFNPRLRVALQNAKGANLPKDNIERAIKKASEGGGETFLEPTYEGYAPGGVAIFVECATDNINRTVMNIRAYFNKNNGSLATKGSVDFLFDRKGIFIVDQNGLSEDEFTMEMIDAGAEDVELEEGEFVITVAFEDFGNMQKKLEEINVETKSAELQRIPKTTTSVDDDTARKALKLVEAIEEDDDVQAVYHNMELSDSIMEEMV